MSDWQQQARVLTQQHPQLCEAWPRLDEGVTGVACSGGADSVCLLLLAWAMHERQGSGQLKVLHLNHGLRGDDSDGDATLVKAIADTLGLTFFSKTLTDVPAEPSEAYLREKRLAFYRSSGCGQIFVGHHADDVAETLLMRLTRGSGTDGLAAPRREQVFADGLTLLRPLLSVTKAGIIQSLTDCGIAWREDTSNTQPDYFRNRVRASVLPSLIAAASGNALAGFSRSHALLSEDADALEAWLATFELNIEHGHVLECWQLVGQPVALWRRALQRWLLVNDRVDCLNAQAVDALLAKAVAGVDAKVSLSASEAILFREGQFSILKAECQPQAWPQVTLREGLSLWMPTGKVLRVGKVRLNDEMRRQVLAGKFRPERVVFLDAATLALPLMARQWQDGDRYQPLGAPGSRKLQDCFTDAKIPALERKRLPVVSAADGSILWCPGFPPTELSKITSHTEWALRLTYGED